MPGYTYTNPASLRAHIAGKYGDRILEGLVGPKDPAALLCRRLAAMTGETFEKVTRQAARDYQLGRV